MNTSTVRESWPPRQSTDQELVEQCKRGDEEAVAQLIGRHYEASIRIARSILRNQADAEDAVQTAYTRAFQYLHTFRDEARFSTWISSIVINQCRMQLRSQRRAILLSLEEPSYKRTPLHLKSRQPTPEEITARKELSTSISRAVANLPKVLRMPYTMHAFSGLPLAEVAVKLGISLSATKSRIFRARCTLESRLSVSYGPARCSA